MVEPETRPSLMVRLRDPSDQQAWTQFVTIYEPLLLRLMRSRGFQEADARDVTQQVVVAVMQAVDTWQPDGRDASFRRWLFGIARRLALKSLQRGSPPRGPVRRGAGGTEMLELLNSLPEPEQRTVDSFDDEYRNEIFQWAATRVRDDFRETTWKAFWHTCVLQQPVADVAETLGMTAGNVYVARSRVIARLRQFIEEFEGDHDL